MVNDNSESDSEKGSPLLPLHRLLFPIISKVSFICTIPQDSTHHGLCCTICDILAEREITPWVHHEGLI